MTAQNKRNQHQTAGADRIYPTASHRLLDMTSEELLADMARRGETKAGALARFDRIIEKARGQTAPPEHPERRLPALLADQLDADLVSRIAFFDERVAAGRPVQGDGGTSARPATLADFFGRQDWSSLVAARVTGSSMRDAHIGDGETVLVDTRREAKDGDIVLAHVGGLGQVVKRLRLTALGGVSLDSANPAFGPIEVRDISALTIHGVVVARSGKF